MKHATFIPRECDTWMSRGTDLRESLKCLKKLNEGVVLLEVVSAHVRSVDYRHMSDRSPKTGTPGGKK